LADRLLGGVAQQLPGSRIPTHNGPIGGHPNNGILRRLDDCDEVGLVFFRLLAHDAYNLKTKHQIVMRWILQTGVLADNSELKDNVESYLGELFQANRLTRNASGHPTGREIQRDKAYGFLYLFPSYLKTIKELMEFLESTIADPT